LISIKVALKKLTHPLYTSIAPSFNQSAIQPTHCFLQPCSFSDSTWRHHNNLWNFYYMMLPFQALRNTGSLHRPSQRSRSTNTYHILNIFFCNSIICLIFFLHIALDTTTTIGMIIIIISICSKTSFTFISIGFPLSL